jgi:hypothetical protein
MGQAARTVMAIARLPRAFDDDLERISLEMPTFAPIETLVDWLEATYGGPLDVGK